MNRRVASLLLLVVGVCCLFACGGGGGGGGSTYSPPVTPVTPPVTPSAPLLSIGKIGTLQAIVGVPASWTFTAEGGTPPYTWSALASLPAGFSFDAAKATISGTPTSTSSAAVMVQVSDSGSPQQTAKAAVAFDVRQPLTFYSASPLRWSQFGNPYGSPISFGGGFPPYTVAPAGGALPPGVKLIANGANSYFGGPPLATGDYSFAVSVTDSSKPAQTATQQYTIKVTVPTLRLNSSLPARIALNRAFIGKFVAVGGVPPYTFSSTGSLPPGLGPIDSATGQISGTPSAAGVYDFTVNVWDSALPAQFSSWFYRLNVAAPLGRNDSPATATPISNGTTEGSLSPYVDPADGTPEPADHDYYVADVAAGGVISVQLSRDLADVPLDPVLEIVDANGHRLHTCGDIITSPTYTSACIDDDPEYQQRALLSYRVPADPAGVQKVYIHVFDWRGDARPDMAYDLYVMGAFVPITFKASTLPTGIVGSIYYASLGASGGQGWLTATLLSGQLPPGISVATNYPGLTGTPTTAGAYSFTVQVSDTATPQQVVSQAFTMDVYARLEITVPAIPQLSVGQTYTQQVQVTGGASPYQYSPLAAAGACNASIAANGLITFNPTAAGACWFYVTVQDSGTPAQTASTTVSVTVSP